MLHENMASFFIKPTNTVPKLSLSEPSMKQRITQGTQLYFALRKAVKLYHKRQNQSRQDP